MVFYPSRLWVNGLSVWPIGIFIKAHRKGDAALLAHEKTHAARQAVVGIAWAALVCAVTYRLNLDAGWFWLAALNPWYVLYLLWPAFRFREEVHGYKAQIEAGGMTPSAAAYSIRQHYRTGRSFDECLEALSD